MKLLATKKKLSVHRSSDIYKIPIITRSMEYFKEFIAFEDPNLTNVLESQNKALSRVNKAAKKAYVKDTT